MARPTFQKTGVTTVVTSKASTFPSGTPLTPNQFVGVADDNTIRVFSLGTARRHLQVVLQQLTSTDIANLEGFFTDPLVNWGVNSFTYTDEDSTSYTVRFLQPVFDPQQVSDNNFNLQLTFTVE